MTHDDDHDDTSVARLPIADGRAELLEEIMAENRSNGPERRIVVVPFAAAAAVVTLVMGIALVVGDRHGTPVTPAGSADVCWDGSAGPTCPAPAGRAALPWVFPRLAGHLDQCVNALAADSDDPPMPFGTPGAGAEKANKPAAYRCDLSALARGADNAAPRVWVYALGDVGVSEGWNEYLPNIVKRFESGTFSIGGEEAGRLVMDEVGLIHPSHFFIAQYQDYPFAVMGYADDKAEAEQIIAALGARRPSEMTAPGVPSPSLPDFPSQALRSPEPTPS